MPAAVCCSMRKPAYPLARIRRCESLPAFPCRCPSRWMRSIRKRRHITPRPMGAAKPHIAVWLLACPMAFAADLRDGFNLRELEPKVFVHLGRQLALDVPGHDDIANIGFIVGEKCVA